MILTMEPTIPTNLFWNMSGLTVTELPSESKTLRE